MRSWGLPPPLLREDAETSVFEPEETYALASLSFIGVISILCPQGKFCLNSTIVDFGGVLAEAGRVTFSVRIDMWVRPGHVHALFDHRGARFLADVQRIVHKETTTSSHQSGRNLTVPLD